MANSYSLEVVGEETNIADTTAHIIYVPGIEVQSPPVNWIKDFLQTDLPTTTVLKFTYHHSLTWTSSSIENHSKHLLLKIAHFRASQAQKSQPIIFIGHSLGGLIVKQALATSYQSQDNAPFRQISKATKGIIFLGTPHSFRPSLVKQLDDIVRAYIHGTSCVVHSMGAVDLASDILDGFKDLTNWMAPWMKIVSFFEELPVPGQRYPVVGSNDAEIPGHLKLPVHAHHLNIAQFRSRTSAAYMQLVASLKSILWAVVLLHSGLYEAGQVKHNSAILPLSVPRIHEVLRGIPKAASGTCSWVFDSIPFKTWIERDSSLLWLHGKPGSGKTTLLRSITQDLLEQPTSFGLHKSVSFFFFSLGHGEARNTGRDVIDFLQGFLTTYYPQREEDRNGHESSIHNFNTQDAKAPQNHAQISKLNTALATLQHVSLRSHIILLIDGLDEYEESIEVATSIRDTLSISSALHSIRILISSRLQPQLEKVPQIRLEDYNTTDIKTYCLSRLMTKDVAYRDFLAREIARRANGMFLWVKLLLSQLGHLHSKVDLSQVQLPIDLSEALVWTMDTVLKDENTSNLSKTLLRWISFAGRPLSIYEIQQALGTTSFVCPRVCKRCSEGNNTTKCCFLGSDESNYRHTIIGIELLTQGLLEVVDDTVQLIHYSAKEFLIQKIEIQEKPTESHQLLALACLQYLRAVILDLGDTLEKDQKPTTSIYPFLEYATFYWMYHLRLSGTISEFHIIYDVLQDFISPVSSFRDGWITIYNQFSPNPKRFNRRTTTPLHVICCFNIPVPSNKESEVFSRYCDVEDHVGRTPLSLACEMGHVELCNKLISMGAHHYTRDEVYGQTALGWAIAEGHQDIVRLLLRHDADPKNDLGGTVPLHLAIHRLDITIVDLLLQNGADATVLDKYTGQSALSLASSLGDTHVMSLLLDRGAEILGKDQGNEWTPLHHAVSKGGPYALKTLISSLSDSQIQELKYRHVPGPFTWVDRVLRYSIGGVYCHSPGRRASLQSGTPSWMDGELRNNYSSARKSGEGRGKQIQNYGNEDGDEDEDESRPGGITPPDSPNQHPRFACPYEKVCPEEIHCSPSGFPSMYRVKAHVIKKHEIKRCWVCCRHFREEVELRDHTCAQIRLPIQYEKGFDGIQKEEIKATKPIDFPSEVDHWRRVFELCFPNWNPAEIPDPYHNDIGARILEEETLTRIIEIGPNREALRRFLGGVVEPTSSAIVNTGRFSTFRDLRPQTASLNPSQPPPTSAVTGSVNWQMAIDYGQQSATAQGTPYNHTSSSGHNMPTYAPLVPRPNCTSVDGSVARWSGTSEPSHARYFTNSIMDQSINSHETGNSDQFSLPSRSDTSNQANTRYQDMFTGVPTPGHGFVTTRHLEAPSMDIRNEPMRIITGQSGTNPGTGYPMHVAPQATNREYTSRGQPPGPWNLDSRHAGGQQPAGVLSYSTYPTPTYPLGGTSSSQGPYRGPNGGTQQGNMESLGVSMDPDETREHPRFSGQEFPSRFHG